MEKDERFFNSLSALHHCSRFSFHDLSELLYLNADAATRNMNFSMYLNAVVHNLLLGRPVAPSASDIFVAEFYTLLNPTWRSDTMMCFRNVKTHPQEWRGASTTVLIDLLNKNDREAASFELALNTPTTDETSTRLWSLHSVLEHTFKVRSISKTLFAKDTQPLGRFKSYTIFDGLAEPVTVGKLGNTLLNQLRDQIEEYASEDAADLYTKFLAYADYLLATQDEIECVYTITPMLSAVELHVELFKLETKGMSEYHKTLTSYQQVLNKKSS